MHRRRERNLKTALTSLTPGISDIPLSPPRLVAMTADDKPKQKLRQNTYVRISRVLRIT